MSMWSEENLALGAGLIDASYVQQGRQALRRRQKQLTALLSSRRLPPEGWDEASVSCVVRDLALMDSNNFLNAVGAGEREGRVFSGLVRRRHFSFAHGIGRSGDVSATQPKAAGASLVLKMTNFMVRDAVRIAGLTEVRDAMVFPTATGMTLALTLLALRQERPAAARFVVWPRIDQKSCFKCISTAGLEAIVVPELRDGDALTTDLDALSRAIESHGPDRILAVLSTTSCFAPRTPDDVEGIARLCAAHGVPHVINNAYGLGCATICAEISRAMRVGRVDFVVQSTDKNFMVPVGGAVVASGAEGAVGKVARAYPGRASGAPVLDLFITLLQMGAEGWQALLDTRRRLSPALRAAVAAVAERRGARVLSTPRNTISFALELPDAAGATALGSMIFTRGVSGARACAPGAEKEIAGTTFRGWGTHEDAPRRPYVTVACAIGMREEEVPALAERLERAFRDWEKARDKAERKARRQGDGAEPPAAAGDG